MILRIKLVSTEKLPFPSDYRTIFEKIDIASQFHARRPMVYCQKTRQQFEVVGGFAVAPLIKGRFSKAPYIASGKASSLATTFDVSRAFLFASVSRYSCASMSLKKGASGASRFTAVSTSSIDALKNSLR